MNFIQKAFKSNFILKKLTGVAAVKFLGMFLAIMSHVLIARMCGAGQYGIYMFALSWVVVLSLLCRVGFDSMLIRFISKLRVEENWSKLADMLRQTKKIIWTLSIISGLGISLIWYFLFPDFKSEYLLTCIIGLTFALPCMSIATNQQNILNGFKHVEISGIPLEVVRYILLLSAVAILHFMGLELVAAIIMIINAAVLFIVVLINTVLINKRVPEELKAIQTAPPDHKESWIKKGLPFLAISWTNTINNKADLLVLGVMVEPVEVGIYAAVTRVLPFLALGGVIANTTIRPYISDLFSKNKIAELRKMTFFTAFLVASITVASVLVLVFLGKFILGQFGPAFEAGYPILLILLIGRLVSVLTGPVGILLTMTDNQVIASKIDIANTILTIGLMIPCIYYWGTTGAAIAITATLILRNIVMTYYTNKLIAINPTIFNPSEFRNLIQSFKR